MLYRTFSAYHNIYSRRVAQQARAVPVGTRWWFKPTRGNTHMYKIIMFDYYFYYFSLLFVRIAEFSYRFIFKII